MATKNRKKRKYNKKPQAFRVQMSDLGIETVIVFRDWKIMGFGSLDDLQNLINQLRGVK